MKKTIVTIMGVITSFMAIAGNCSPTPVEDTAWVYEWKFTGKTTSGVAVKQVVSSPCHAGDDVACAARTPASLKIQGYTYYCSPGCGVDSFESDLAEANEIFWSTRPYKCSLAGGLTTEVCNIIGKKKDKTEIAATATFDDPVSGGTYTFTLAGIGKYDAKKGRISSCSGNFSGTLSKPVYFSKNLCSPIYAGCWTCGDLLMDCEEKPTVVYGKWSCKFKKTLSKKYLKNGTTGKTPSWVEALNQN